MSILLQLFEVVLLRRKPQDLPVDLNLLAMTAVAAMATDFLLDAAHSEFLARAWFAIAQSLIFGLVVFALLKLSGRPERWMQSIAPLYFVNTVISLAALPFVGAMSGRDGPSTLGYVVSLVMIAWLLAVVAHVLRNALEVTAGRALLVAVGVMMVTGLMVIMMFPEVIKAS